MFGGEGEVHLDVLDVSLCEGRAHRNETKPFVERRCLDLCV